MESNPSEAADLVRRASQGDGVAVGDLLERHLPDLRVYVDLRTGARLRARESSADIVQSVCREVLEDMDDFDYRGEGAFRNWLFQLAFRKIIDKDRYHRAKRRDVEREEIAADSGTGAEPFVDALSPSRVLMGQELEAELVHAFERLPEEHREAILLTRIVGLSHEEAAKEMKRSVGSVRMLVYRGIARLGLALEARDGQD